MKRCTWRTPDDAQYKRIMTALVGQHLAGGMHERHSALWIRTPWSGLRSAPGDWALATLSYNERQALLHDSDAAMDCALLRNKLKTIENDLGLSFKHNELIEVEMKFHGEALSRLMGAVEMTSVGVMCRLGPCVPAITASMFVTPAVFGA